MKELKMDVPEMMETDQGSNQFMQIFGEWFRSDGSKPINPDSGLTALFRQYTDWDEETIKTRLGQQQEAELFFNSIQSGIDGARGEPFFNFLNPTIVKDQKISACQICGKPETNASSNNEKLGLLEVHIEAEKTPFENLHNLIQKEIVNEYQAICPRWKDHLIDQGESVQNPTKGFIYSS